MRLAGGARAELQRDDGRYVARSLCQGRVVQEQLVVLLTTKFELRIQAIARQGRLYCRLYVGCDSARQSMPHGLRPFASLAATGRQLTAFADQVGDQLADVVGQVDVFGETIDDLVNLRQ